MGSLPADSEQFMLIEHIAGQLEQVQKSMESMMNNGNRDIIYQNGKTQ